MLLLPGKGTLKSLCVRARWTGNQQVETWMEAPPAANAVQQLQQTAGGDTGGGWRC